eukprot:5935645-Amphidinium_carterae.1
MLGSRLVSSALSWLHLRLELKFPDIYFHRTFVAWCGGDVSRGSASGLVAPSSIWCQVCLRGSADWFTSSTRVLPRPPECLVQEYLPPTRVRQLQHLQVKTDHDNGTSIHRLVLLNTRGGGAIRATGASRPRRDHCCSGSSTGVPGGCRSHGRLLVAVMSSIRPWRTDEYDAEKERISSSEALNRTEVRLKR